MDVSQDNARRALSLAVTARVPVLLWGGPGTGKSSAVRALADSMGLPCEVVIASIREPSDFAGLPIVEDGKVVNFAPPRWAQRLVSAGHGILFLDEISTAAPAVQSALLRVVLERVVGDLELPAEVTVIAAANPPEQISDGWDLSPALANRFCHIDWVPDASSFADGMTTGWPKSSVPAISGDATKRITARSLVAAFASVRPGLLSSMPRDAAAAGRAWPSPRSWEMAAELMAATEGGGEPTEVRRALIAGVVGQAAAIEFLTWVIDMDLPNPEETLSDPAGFELPERGDRAYAALSAIAAAVAAKPTRARWITAWRILDKAGGQAPDIAATAARMLVRCRPAGVRVPKEAGRFAPLMKDAGLI